jgi:hypothetical protein
MFVEDTNHDAAPKKIQVDLKRLRLRDMTMLEKLRDGNSDFSVMVPVFARVCNLTEAEVWDWDFETLMTVQSHMNTAMDDVLKKTNGGS